MSDDIKIELTVSRELITDSDAQQLLGQAALEVALDVLNAEPDG